MSRPVEGVPRFELRALGGFLALVAGGVPFLLLLLLVRHEWAPLRAFDQRTAAQLDAVLRDSSASLEVLKFLTDLGGNGVAVYVFTVTAAFLKIRAQPPLTWFVATTGVGLALLVPVMKAIVGRARPLEALPGVGIPDNASFPSGHATVATVTWGMLALICMPALSAGMRRWLLMLAVLIALIVGATRVALGVHFLTDVVAGWVLGGWPRRLSPSADGSTIWGGRRRRRWMGSIPTLVPWSSTSRSPCCRSAG